jgi:hypothetical protein
MQKIRNRGNLKHTARRCGIINCLSIPKEELLQPVKVCIIQCNYFQRHGKQYRQKHLLKCLNNAKDSKDEQRVKEILAIIQREKDRSFWHRLNYSMGKPQSGLVCRVLVEDEIQEGALTEFSTQESIQQAIFENIHLRRFCLTEAAHICSGCLQGDFGYNAMTPTTTAILNGSYHYNTPLTLIKQQEKYARNAPALEV